MVRRECAQNCKRRSQIREERLPSVSCCSSFVLFDVHLAPAISVVNKAYSDFFSMQLPSSHSTATTTSSTSYQPHSIHHHTKTTLTSAISSTTPKQMSARQSRTPIASLKLLYSIHCAVSYTDGSWYTSTCIIKECGDGLTGDVSRGTVSSVWFEVVLGWAVGEDDVKWSGAI